MKAMADPLRSRPARTETFMFDPDICHEIAAWSARNEIAPHGGEFRPMP
jgi:hypothetical protein